MERLTERGKGNDHVYFTSKPKGFLCHENFCSYAYKCEKIKDRKCPYLAVMDRLAAYEDTGLEPWEIERIQDAYGRGLSLRTESAERLQLIREIPTERLRELVEADRDGRCVVPPCKVGETVFYLTGKPSLSANPIYEKVESSVVSGFYWDNRGLQIRLRSFKGNHGTYGFYNETVFLTRESAEAALKGEQDGVH